MSKIIKKRCKGFTFTEVLIAVIIVGILGGVASAALWLFFNSFSQMGDYVSAETQLNFAVQMLSRDFALIGLGMPNNRDGDGSFAWSFRGNGAAWPVTANFGGAPPEWGGPVTVAAGAGGANNMPLPVPLVNPPGGPNHDLFIGPELFYAFAVPTGVMVTVTAPGWGPQLMASHGTNLWLQPRMELNTGDTNPEHQASIRGEAALRNTTWGGVNVGLLPANEGPGAAPTSDNIRSWVLLPTLRIPMLANEFSDENLVGTEIRRVLQVTASPAPAAGPAVPNLQSRDVMVLDEVHLMQAARVYRNPATRELRRSYFSTPGGPATRYEVLASNVVGLQFAFDPERRVLMMFVAARGNERNPSIGVGQLTWPTWLPEISAEDRQFRIVTKTLTWRLRN